MKANTLRKSMARIMTILALAGMLALSACGKDEAASGSSNSLPSQISTDVN